MHPSKVSTAYPSVCNPTSSISPSKLAVYNSDSSHSGPANRGNENDLPYFTKDFEHGRGTVEMVRDSECM